MTLRLTCAERRQARAYKTMLRIARKRAKRCVDQRQASPGCAPLSNGRGRLIDREHKAAVAQLFCVATAVRCGVEVYGVQVAHIRFSNAAFGAINPGLQRKPDDRWVVPLSPSEHRLQHRLGEAIYWNELKLNPHRLASTLWAVSPDIEVMKETLRAGAAKSSHAKGLAEAPKGQRTSIFYNIKISGLFDEETK